MPTKSQTKSRSGESHQPSPVLEAEKPPDGLDEARHTKNQLSAQQADALREGIFPALMASALQLDKFLDTPAFKVFLKRLHEDAGSPTSPIARMMIEQLALAHFRIAQLQIKAAHAEGLEAAKIYNAMAARLLGEFRRSALALEFMSSRSSEPNTKARFKVMKMAQ